MAPLSPANLFILANKIKSSDIEKVLRQLGLPEENIEKVRHYLKKYPLLTDDTVESFLFLLEWRSKYPEKCTLENLLQALRELQLNNTADKVKNEVENEWESEESSSEQNTNCNDTSVVDDRMVNIVSKILPTSICTSLGLTLGLNLQQMDHVGNTCKTDNTRGIIEVLKIWREVQSSNAVLGRLYRALRRLGKNALAEEVYHKCKK